MRELILNKHVNKNKKHRAVFLDRDGTINKEVNLLHKISQIRIIKNTAKGIKLLNKKGCLVIIVTNQPVVARNLCTEKDVVEINETIRKRLLRRGAKIDAIYYCPHHPERNHPEANDPRYRRKCSCRKPSSGMIKKAAEILNIDLVNSFVIGDSTRDIQAGQNVGCKTILVKTGYAGKDKRYDVKPDQICDNLYSACSLIAKDY